MLFGDDPLLTAAERRRSEAADRFAWVSAAPLESGVLVVRRAIRLKMQGDRFDPRMRFGLRTCGAPTAQSAEIHTGDVDRFYKIYDAAGGHPTAEQLQRDYLDQGSEGLHQLAKLRNVTGVRIADTLTKRPELYSDAKRCLAVLPRVRQRVDVALRKLVRLYPQARLRRSRSPSAAASPSVWAVLSPVCRLDSRRCARPNG